MKTISFCFLLIAWAGCDASHTRPDVDLERIYSEALGRGAADQVSTVTGKIRRARTPAGTDVFIPIRQRAWIVEAYVPDHVNANGDHVRGHYVDLVIEPERWVSPAFETEAHGSGTRLPGDVPVLYEGK